MPKSQRSAQALFGAACLACLLPLSTLPTAVASAAPPVALLVGATLGLTSGNPFPDEGKRAARLLLQASVVLLGFAMDFRQVAQAGRDGLGFALFSIAAVFGLGWLLQRAMGIRPVTGLLVSAGTAICGGSAIAAVSSVVDAPEEDVTVAVGAVFLLNAVALLVFPPLGHLFGLSQHAFGVWSGIAIHDIASVVGAGASYGPQALDEATAVKLSRVLYLAPVTFLAAWWSHRAQPQAERSRMAVPWFVGLFLLASAARSLLPALTPFAGDVKRIAATGFVLSLFLIGAGLSRTTLRRVGVRPLAMGALLWLFVSAVSLVLVRSG